MDVTQLSFEELLEKYEPIIKKQIKQLNMYGYFDELYQVGAIALWEAKMKFDPSKGNFTRFTQKYIKGRMLTFFQKELRFQNHCQTGLEPELIENIPIQSEREPLSFPAERMKPLLARSERIWFTEFYENRKEQMEIAKQYQVSVNTVKKWRIRALEKIRANLKTSELLELMKDLNR